MIMQSLYTTHTQTQTHTKYTKHMYALKYHRNNRN